MLINDFYFSSSLLGGCRAQRKMSGSCVAGAGFFAYAQAGGGVVADSVPLTEYQETRNKAAGLFAAIDRAENGL